MISYGMSELYYMKKTQAATSASQLLQGWHSLPIRNRGRSILRSMAKSAFCSWWYL
jgi:hypothetical protein